MYVAYSVNKGEELAICLRHAQEGYPFNDNNSIMFTTGHELAHVMNKTVGHDESFWSYMKFNLEEMEKIGQERKNLQCYVDPSILKHVFLSLLPLHLGSKFYV